MERKMIRELVMGMNGAAAAEWAALSGEEKKKQLYLRQKQILDMFLERNAISQAQYDKSLGDLTVKMGMEALRNVQS